MAAVGGAVDYSHANWVKSSMQDAVDATALMLAKNATTQSAAQLQTVRDLVSSWPTSPAPTRRTAQVTATYSQSQSGGFTVTVNGTATVNTNFMNVLGISQIADLDHRLGELEQRQAARRARARQHRLDGRQRQDHRAQDRDPQSADAVAERRQQRRRRLRLDHSVRARTSMSAPATTTQSWIDWTDWDAGQRHLQQSRPTRPHSTCVVPGTAPDLDAEQPQHLERLRHRPRPELRHAEHRADDRRHPVPGRAVFSPARRPPSWGRATTGPRSTTRSTR